MKSQQTFQYFHIKNKVAYSRSVFFILFGRLYFCEAHGDRRNYHSPNMNQFYSRKQKIIHDACQVDKRIYKYSRECILIIMYLTFECFSNGKTWLDAYA